MHNYRGNFVEAISRIKNTIIEEFSIKALADESNDDSSDDKGGEDNSSRSSSTINYEDLIAKARKEEKDKQYKTIEKYKSQVNTLTEQHNNDLLKIAELEDKLKTAETKLTSVGSGDSEEVKTLKTELETLKSDNVALMAKVKDFETNFVSRETVEAEVRAELEAEYEVKTYKATKLAEMKDDILVPELVFGSTKEEIDDSIKKALERSNEIKKSLGFNSNSGAPRTPKSPTNPSISKVQDKNINLERLASMDVSSKEYAEMRKQLGLH